MLMERRPVQRGSIDFGSISFSSFTFSSPLLFLVFTFSNSSSLHYLFFIRSVCLPPPSVPVNLCYIPPPIPSLSICTRLSSSSLSLLFPRFVLISLSLYPSLSLSLYFSVEINGRSLNRRSRGCRRWRPGFSITGSLQLPQHTHTHTPL